MQLVQRTLDVLAILSKESEGLSVSELAQRLSIPSSSTHRILAVLKKNNFVLQSSDTKKYRIGYKVLALGNNITKESSFAYAARPYLRELAGIINMTVTLCVMEGDNVICLDYIESKDTSMFMVRTGFAMPPHATSAGKIIQAYLPRERVYEIYERNTNAQLTNYTKTDIELILAELEEARLQGYAVSDEELQLGVQGVACPIFDYNNQIVACISFTALKSDHCLTKENIDLLREYAKKVSNSIA